METSKGRTASQCNAGPITLLWTKVSLHLPDIFHCLCDQWHSEALRPAQERYNSDDGVQEGGGAPVSTSWAPCRTAWRAEDMRLLEKRPESMPCSFHMYTPSATPSPLMPGLQVQLPLAGSPRVHINNVFAAAIHHQPTLDLCFCFLTKDPVMI